MQWTLVILTASNPVTDVQSEEENDGASEKKSAKSSKPVFLKDMERKVILEHDGFVLQSLPVI